MPNDHKPLNPFNANDIAAAQAIIESADLAEELLAKCESCGVDFAPVAAEVRSYKEFAQGIIREFGHIGPANAT